MPLLVVLVTIDALLIFIHAVLGVLVLTDVSATYPERLRIDRDWGLGEIFGYMKWLWIAGILLSRFRQTNALIFLGLGSLCLLALADDGLQLHENFAETIFPRLGLHTVFPAGSGEVVFLALAGLLVFAPLLIGWLRAGPALRHQLVPFLILFGGVVFCVAIVDFIHTQLPDQSLTAGLLGILEDGGEMVFLSMMVSYAVGTFAGPRQTRPEWRSF